MDIIVQKYGGTSVGTPEKIKRVAKRVLQSRASGSGVVVVVSAMGDTTDHLIEMASHITKHPTRRELDMLLSTGEQISIALLSMAIEELGGRAISMTGLQSGIMTDSNYTEAKITQIKTDRIVRQLACGKIAIVAGFQGVSRGSEITTLGRGGSDTTAAALAAALGARVCEIYTDVAGVYTADPNIIRDAVKLDYISYEEMLELAGFGAQVLHPRAVEIAKNFRIPMQVRSSYSDAPGTEILEEKKVEKVAVTGITANKNVAKIAIQKVPDRPGIAAQMFDALGKAGINVRLIIQSIGEGKVNDVTIVVDRKYAGRAVAVLENIKNRTGARGVIHDSALAEVSIVGSGISTTARVPARMFRALAKKKINIELISTSAIRITCVVERPRADEAMQALHDEFDLGRLARRLK
jgi:aspartate kinase